MSYSIVNFCEEQMKIIKTFDSYEAADAAFDEFSERLPHAWLEIVNTAEAESVVWWAGEPVSLAPTEINNFC